MKYCISILFFVLLLSCHEGHVVIRLGFESNTTAHYYGFRNSEIVDDYTIINGNSRWMDDFAVWDEDDDFRDKLLLSGISVNDSVWFINSDSTLRITYINPILDDSLDYKLKSSHFWNIDNWNLHGNRDINFVISANDFDLYGVAL